MIKQLFTGILFLLFITVPANATTYYVDTTCSEVSTYDPATPACTGGSDIVKDDVADINGINFADGDIISFRKGQTHDDAHVDFSSVTSPTTKTLTITSHGSGTLPWLGGTTKYAIFIDNDNQDGLSLVVENIRIDSQEGPGSTTANSYAKIWLKDLKNITIDGVTGDGSVSWVSDQKRAIYITDSTGTVEVKNCTLTYWGGDNDLWGSPATPTGTTRDGSALTFAGIYGGTISVHDNDIENVESDCILFENVTPTSVGVYDNTLWNCGENSLDFKHTSNASAYGNTAGRDATFVGAGGSSTGESDQPIFQVIDTSNGGSSNISIYHNVIGPTDMANFRSVSTNTKTNSNISVYRNYFKKPKWHIIIKAYQTGLKVHNNVFDDLQENGMFVWEYFSTAPATYPVFYNNTFYVGTDYASPGSYGGATDNSLVQIYNSDCSWINNIFQINDATDNIMYVRSDSAPTINHNLWYNSNGSAPDLIDWKGTGYDSTEQASWISAGHTGAVFDNPDFTDASSGDFSLQVGSPAIDPAGSSTICDNTTYKDGWSPVDNNPLDGLDTIDRYVTGQCDMGAIVADTTAPTTISSGPSGNLPYDTTKTIYINCDEDLTDCKYDSADTTYDLMGNTMGTCSGAGCEQSVSVSEGSNTFYGRCKDIAGNKQTSSATITFTVQAEESPNSPSPVAIGQGISGNFSTQ